MRRVALAVLLVLLVLVPATGAVANDCPSLTGVARLDFGSTGTGEAKLVHDGRQVVVDFVNTGFVETGPGTADIFFDFFFPDGTVSIVEHSTNTPIGGPRVAFASEIEVLDGGEGHWTWSGVANVFEGFARIESIDGNLCVGGSEV